MLSLDFARVSGLGVLELRAGSFGIDCGNIAVFRGFPGLASRPSFSS
jgi:hypothetical protein